MSKQDTYALTWLERLTPGDALITLSQCALWPEWMWSSVSYDDRTWMMTSTQNLREGDICSVLDVLKNEPFCGDESYSALVVCHLGVGCIFTTNEHFKLLWPAVTKKSG